MPSFTQYKTQDALDWVVQKITNIGIIDIHTLPTFKHYQHSSIASFFLKFTTLKSKFNGISTIIRLLYKGKSADSYEKFSRKVSDLGHYFEDDEFDNKLSPEEFRKFIQWDDVLAKQKSLENLFNSIQNKQTKTAYDMNNDLLLLSLYSLIPPLRNEVKHLNFTHSKNLKDDGDYTWFTTDGRVFIDLNLEKKRHDRIQFNLTKDAPNIK